MSFGPCGGVRPDTTCELGDRPCPFAARQEPVPWAQRPPEAPPPTSSLLTAIATGPVVLTDLTLPAYDPEGLTEVVSILSRSADAVLVGEHQNRPDFPPTTMAALIRQAGGTAWVTLACRDRNRLVLEQELAGLRLAGADGVLCVTGDARAPGVRPGVTQVFDLEGTSLAALAASAGHAVAVPESPDAIPQALRPHRLVQKQRAGAHLAVLNHVGSAEAVAEFVGAAREAGLTIPVLAAVAVFTDEHSARVLQRFPGLHLDPRRVEAVLEATDPRAAGIETAVTEAQTLLSIEGVAGVNLSGLASASGPRAGAEVKAEIGRRIRESMWNGWKA